MNNSFNYTLFTLKVGTTPKSKDGICISWFLIPSTPHSPVVIDISKSRKARYPEAFGVSIVNYRWVEVYWQLEQLFQGQL